MCLHPCFPCRSGVPNGDHGEINCLPTSACPAQDGVALCDPPPSQALALLEQNVSSNSASGDLELGNRRLSELRREARQEMQILARAYTSEYRDVPAREVTVDTPVILAGHQPDLVHPGVWFKNFVLSSLAEQTEALAVNLLIDNDAVRGTAVRVPTGSWDDPVSTFVPLDDMSGIMPFEARRVRNRGVFAQFGRRAAQAVRPLVGPPLLESFWPLAREAMLPGTVTWAARWRKPAIAWRANGDSTASSCRSVRSVIPTRFAGLPAALLHDAARFRDIHNRMLADYRRVNRIRSHTHPVPDLAVRDGWQEVPFWLWTAKNLNGVPLSSGKKGLSGRCPISETCITRWGQAGNRCRAIGSIA